MPRTPTTMTAEEVAAFNAKIAAAKARPLLSMLDEPRQILKRGKIIYRTSEGKTIVPLTSPAQDPLPPTSPAAPPKPRAARKKLEVA